MVDLPLEKAFTRWPLWTYWDDAATFENSSCRPLTLHSVCSTSERLWGESGHS